MPKLTLRKKLLVLTVILALIPIGIAGRTLIDITRGELKSFANEEVVLTAEQLAREVDGLVQDAWLPALTIMRDTLDDKNLGDREKAAVLQGSKEVPDLVALQITAEGSDKPALIIEGDFAERLARAGYEPNATLGLPAERVFALRKADGMFVGDITHLDKTDDWLATIVLPLENPVQGKPGALSARVDLSRLRGRVETHRFTQTGTIAIVDTEGRRFFDPKRTDLSSLELVKGALGMLRAGRRSAGAMPYVKPGGEAMLGGYAIPRFLPWAVVVERSEATAYQGIRKMTQSLVLWVGIGSLVAVVGAFLFSGHISRPIVEIGRAAEKVGEGNFEVRVRSLASGDEIAELGARINAMIEGLAERERVKGENALLKDLTEKLRALNDQKNRFLGMAAHDLRNPIGGILGYSEMILEEEGLDEEVKTLVTKIQSSSQFMLRLLNDLLDISQIESGKLDLNLQRTDLVRLVTQNVELNRIIAGKKNIKVELQHGPDVPELDIDGSKIEQVLSNLISNGIKYSFPNTTVTVTLERLPEEVLIRVQDQGQGIPAEELHKVFQEFQKTSVKSTAGEKSTGLGLAIVKKIVEGHRGRIGVESEVGKGSTFYVSLPLPSEGADERQDQRRGLRAEADAPVQFSVLTASGAVQAGTGTALDLSTGGMQIDSTVPLKVGDQIRFSLRLPDATVAGGGSIVRQVAGTRYGVVFASLEGDGAAQVGRFVESRAGLPAA